MPKDKINSATAVLSIVLVVVLSLLFFIFPKKDFSDKENRKLSQAPKITAESFFDGDYMDGLTEYAVDHFPLRDYWISLRTQMRILMGASEINGIYLGRDGFLIQRYTPLKNTDKIVTTFNKLGDNISLLDRDTDFKVMLVPTSATVYGDMLPKGAEPSRQLDDIELIYNEVPFDTVDVYPELVEEKNAGIQVFYKTDHHWTPEGAYAGYRAYCEANNMTPVSFDDMKPEVGTTDFHGTYSSKVNRFNEKGDTITLYTNPSAALRVSYEDTGVVTDSLFDRDYLDKKDKYSVFLSNLHSMVVVDNANATTDRVLALVKDSYANSMLPYLSHNYSRMYIFDTRYYKDGVTNFIKEHDDITDVLVLYNMSTIDTDTGIRGIY